MDIKKRVKDTKTKMKKALKVNQVVCPKCGTSMDEVWENNGYTPPMGPSHWEIVGHKCSECGYKKDDNGV